MPTGNGLMSQSVRKIETVHFSDQNNCDQSRGKRASIKYRRIQELRNAGSGRQPMNISLRPTNLHNPTQPSRRQVKLGRDTVSSTECAQPPSIPAIPVHSLLFHRYRGMSMKPSLPCVVQYPLGQVFVSSPG